MIADISTYIQKHPAKYESADDFEPDGTPYSIIAVREKLFVVEPNHGQVLAISENGQISQLIDVSASEGHIVPTSITERDGTFYVGNLNLFPIDPQWARILTISNSDQDDDRLALHLETGCCTQSPWPNRTDITRLHSASFLDSGSC